MSDEFIEIEQVERAAACVNPVFRNTPSSSPAHSERLSGCARY
jgi:hypothetical protein